MDTHNQEQMLAVTATGKELLSRLLEEFVKQASVDQSVPIGDLCTGMQLLEDLNVGKNPILVRRKV